MEVDIWMILDDIGLHPKFNDVSGFPLGVLDPQFAAKQIFKTLVHLKNQLKWVSWTTYNDNLPLPFHIRPVFQCTSSLLDLECLSYNFYFLPTENLNALSSMIVTLPVLCFPKQPSTMSPLPF